MYSGTVNSSRFCCDCEDIWNSELCYEGIEVYGSYNCDFSQFLRNCSDCNHCYDCLNCQNCFGCVGLRRSQNFIFNKRYSQEEYAEKISDLKKMPRAEIDTEVERLRKSHPHVASRQYQTENCFGDNIQNSRDCFGCFNAKNIHSGAWLHDIYTAYGDKCEDVFDCYFSVDLHSCYECIQVGDGWNSNFCHYCEHLHDSEFCEGCFNSKYLFGCAFTNRREYLILNKQYTKDAWHKEVAEIREGLKKSGNYDWLVFG